MDRSVPVPGSGGAAPASGLLPAPVALTEMAVDIMTLENLPQKLPAWSPYAASHLYALVDMGSNGIRFSISDLSPPTARLLSCVYQERAAISLLDALLEGDESTADKFPKETILAVARTLARFRAIAVDGYGVPPGNLIVFATEAMRRASNAADMLKAIVDAAPGMAVHILEPKVETLFGAMGARSAFVSARGLFIDLGGGSLQISYLNSEADQHVSGISETGLPAGPTDADGSEHYGIAAARAGQSLPFGAARMTHIIEQGDSRTLDAEVATLHGGLAAALEKLRRVHPYLAADLAEDGPGVDLYLYGGGLRGYGSMLMFNDPVSTYPLAGVGSYSVSGRYFAETKKMRKVNKKHDGKIPGMSSRRRQQFPAIALVVDAIVAVVPGIRRATFCAGGNREGALIMSLPPPVREDNPIEVLVRRRDDDGTGIFCNSMGGGGGGGGGLPQKMLTLGTAGLSALAAGFAADLLTSTLVEALPESLADELGSANIFSLSLAPLFVRSIWTGASAGLDDDASASVALHHVLGRYPGSTPGLGRIERAVLAVTLVARWGGFVSPADEPLLEKLQAVVATSEIRPTVVPALDSGKKKHKKKKKDGDEKKGGSRRNSASGAEAANSLFWAEYIGATAAALAKVTEAYPRDLLAGGAPRVRFRAASASKLGQETIDLVIDVALPDVLAFDLADLTVPFKKMGKKDGKKVVATAQIVPPWA